MMPPICAKFSASASPISSLSTSTAARPSISMAMLSWHWVTSWTGPIGEQPWVSAVATGTASENITPDSAPSVSAPATWA